jgi:hypothetical protein
LAGRDARNRSDTAKPLAEQAGALDDELPVRSDFAHSIDLVVVAAVGESGEFGEQGFQTRHRRRQAHEPVVHRGHRIVKPPHFQA